MKRAYDVWTSLRSAVAAFVRWDPAVPGRREHDVCSYARQYLLGLPAVQLPGWAGTRFLVSKDIDEILDSYVERRTSSARFMVGPLATAAALVFTFFLIAHVLQNDVHAAVAGASSSTAESSGALASAVHTLGGKFY